MVSAKRFSFDMEGKAFLLVVVFGCGVFQFSSVEANVRLANGVKTRELYVGILQVHYNNEWGTVCDDGWTINNTKVVCRQLGYRHGIARHLGEGTGMIWLDDVACTGDENSVINCRHPGWGVENCDHSEDIGIACFPAKSPKWAFRLGHNPFPNAGGLEVRYHGSWGTLCADNIGLGDGHVICRMMGYRQAARFFRKSLSASASAIKLSLSLNCNGNENSTDYCNTVELNRMNSCSTNLESWIICKSASAKSPKWAFRWGNNPFPNAGRLEVRYHGTWGTLCADNINLGDGHVICRMMGYKQAAAVMRKSLSASAIKVSLSLSCNGNENSTKYCNTAELNRINSCGTNSESWIVCKSASGRSDDGDVAVRLMNGTAPNEGRVEVRYYGVWGTVCDDYWDLADVHVICRMLNYSKALWAGTAKVSGSGNILLDDVRCRGNENSLADCSSNSWGQHNCGHGEDAGVKCGTVTQEESSVTARLVQREEKHIGFVEINYNGTWTPVCDDTWDILDAHVICRMLGYKAAQAPLRQYRKGVFGLWMGGVACTGDEVSIGYCSHRGWTNTRCPGNYYAGVICKVMEDVPPIQVRLEDKRTLDSGRVAVRYGDIWGSICRIGLHMKDVQVLCRMLGYPGAISGYISQSVNGTIWLSNLECNGTEESVVDCRHAGWGDTAPCTHSNDIGVNCMRADAPEFQINETNAITESTVVILFNDSLIVDSGLKSVYQVAVEKRDIERRFKSYKQPPPFVYNEVDVTMATQMGNDSYITAEIPGPVTNLTIGDGQYYHGYYNAPLEPGSMYRVHVRIVTMAMDGERINGHSTFVAFTTKSEIVTTVKAMKEKEAYGHAVIGLSVALTLSICVIIGLVIYCSLKLNKIKKNSESIKGSEMTGIGNSAEANEQLAFDAHYQPLDRRCESTQQQEGCEYENVTELRNQRYQVPKPISTTAFHKEKNTLDEDLYEDI